MTTAVLPETNTMDLHEVARGLRSFQQCGKGAIVGVSPDNATAIAIPMTCKSWVCDNCREKKVAMWRSRVMRGKAQRWLTLTAIPCPDLSFIKQVEILNAAWSKLVREIRRDLGEFHYIKFLERTRAGTPHYHIVQRGCYIPQRWLSAHWKRLTGAHMVDIRKLSNDRMVSRYITKYMAKTAAIVSLALQGLRVVTASRDWLLEPPPPRKGLDTSDFTWYWLKVPFWQVLSDLAVGGGVVVDHQEFSGAYTIQENPLQPGALFDYLNGRSEVYLG